MVTKERRNLALTRSTRVTVALPPATQTRVLVAVEAESGNDVMLPEGGVQAGPAVLTPDEAVEFAHDILSAALEAKREEGYRRVELALKDNNPEVGTYVP